MYVVSGRLLNKYYHLFSLFKRSSNPNPKAKSYTNDPKEPVEYRTDIGVFVGAGIFLIGTTIEVEAGVGKTVNDGEVT